MHQVETPIIINKIHRLIFFSLLALLLLHIICILILSSVPPISRDALIHHLTIPKMYIRMGGIFEIPYMHFSYFPMNLDLLYSIPLFFQNDIAVKYIHFLFALMTAALLYCYLRDVTNKIYGLIGALFFLTIPVIVKLSVTAYVDLGLIFFTWTTLYYFLKWYDSNFSKRYLIFAGIACGLALGTKYNGLILLVIMSAMIPLCYSIKENTALLKVQYCKRYKNSFKGLCFGTVFVAISLTMFSPWMIRNAVWTQNPIYPLYHHVFNPTPPPPPSTAGSTIQKEKTPPRNAFWMRRYIYKESFAQTALIPVRMFFQGQDDNPQYFDGQLNPLLLFLPLMSFFYLSKNKQRIRNHRNILSIFAVIFTLFVLFKTDFRIRYMSPAIPALAVLSVFGLKNMVDNFSQKSRYVKNVGWGVVSLLILFAFVYNANYLQKQFSYIQPLEYLSQKIDRDTYISRYRFEYPVIKYANETLPEDVQVLCLSIGDRTYYIDRNVHLAEDFYDKNNGKFTELELLKKLKRYGTTHIIFNKILYLRWVRHLEREERIAFENVFRKNTKLLYEKNGVLLLEFKQS